MTRPRTVRFPKSLDSSIDQYTKKNGMKFNQLANVAIKKFISGPNTIDLKPVSINDEEWDEKVKKAFSEHRKSMDELS